ncbi:MAG: amino acid adenylation domain-containing protein [Candidatus Aminicenantes bacterium]
MSGLNKDLQQQDCQTIIREFIQRPFKLEKAPLIRVVLVKLETTTHILGMCLHHIIVDGWSLGILTREISQTYAAYKKEKEPGLEELKIQYADYSLWQREVLTEERLDKELKYWEKYLTGYENMDLPGDYPRPRQISGKGGHVKFRLQRQEVNPLTKLGQEKQMTLFTVFVASVYILLRRYSRQQDICLGMPVANRNHREIENLVGFFVNTLVIRINTGEQGNITVGQLLRKVKEEIVAAQDRQNVPFEKVVETLQPTRDLSRTPIFQVLVNYINTGTEEMQLGECQLQEVDFDYKISKFDLAFTFTQQEDKDIKVNLTYNQDLYGEESIRRMGGHLLKIMTNLVEETGKTVDEIDLLSEEEKQKLVIEWNNTAVEYPGDQCIHELFERQVDRTPDNIAAAGPSKVKHRTYMTYMTYISYNELNKKSNQLAQLLMSKSVQPDTVVGIMAERSLELIIGILAILKAGGAYLPIDPEYPPARIRYILEDSNAGVLLTTPKIQVKVKTEVEGNPGQLPGQPLQLINMETDLTPVFEPPLSTLTSTCQVTPADLAYVIYTSGSTGKPKGVMVEHQNILNTLYALQSRYPVNQDDTYLLKTNYVFDVSLTELFAWFLDAGRLVILKPGQEKDPQAILKVLSERKITHINFVPSMLISFLDLVSESDLKVIKYLKYVMVAGEAFPRKLARKSQKKFSQAVKIENIYGPTEISIYATWFSVNDIKESAPQVPIGNPLYNVQAYILSQEGAFQPIGVPGELHIGGAGLARGYLNQPELTAEKFFLAHSSWLIADGKAMKGVVQLPVSYQLSAFSCIYRTGDLARWLADGNIEFLGRMDHQVKIRGFRIECEEIETVLAEHPNVQDAVVIARTINNTTQLAAYYVKIDKDKTLEASETRSYLQGKLPEYMIPVVFVALETIPLMPNGKVDRKALLQIEAEPESSRAYVAPRTGTEKQLTRIWEDVLDKAQIGIHDNFFELGGHSLLATQIISRINRELKVDVPLAKLFEAPRIETLSGVIAESKPYREVPMASIKRPEPLPLSYAQERLWFLVQLGLSERYHLSTIVKLTGKLDPEALQKTINLIAHRHESLRTAFKTLDAAAIQVIEATADIRIELEDLSGIKKEEQERESQTILQDFSQQPFELEKAPLLRVILIKLDGDTHIFGICMHHIISDGWSIGILIKEIRQAYAAHLEGKDPLLEELEIQYADFAVWQREWLQGDTLEKQVSYWKKQLHGVPPLLKLPTDRPRPLTQTFGGDIEYMVLPKTLSSALKSMSQHEGVTLFMTLLAAFKVLLHRYSGEDDIVVGTPIAGRNRAEIEGVIGFFINSLVLRTDLSGHPSFHEVLTRVREVTLGAYAHQDLPFEKLLEELQPERTLSHTPLFQVFFNMLNIGDVEVRLPGLETEPVIPSKIESKFDLTLYVREEEEEIHFRLVYNLDLFERYRMVEMLEQYRYLLEQAAAKPRGKIASFSLVTDRTKAVLPNPLQELDSKWEGAVHTQFSRQAQRHPQRPAVQDNHLVFTYSELEAAGNQLANYLLNNGLGLHEMVAIYAHRSASLVWAVLGVLKAGAAFLILDPVYPDSRLLDCLVQAQPRGFIHLEAAGDLPATIKDFLSGSSCCCVVELPQRPASARNPLTNSSIHNPQVKVDADDLAYIAFTSGSTGKPKGILGRHGSLSHFLPWMQKRFGLQETDRYSMLSGLSHDPLHRDMFTPLWLGATICIPDPDDIEAGRIADWMKETKINIAHLTPAMGQLLTQNASDLPSLRYALFVGDVLTRGDVIRLREISHRVTCVNLYGSTETQRAVGYFVVSSAGSEGTPAPDMKEVLPLGCGMKDVQLLVLNNSKQLAGMGELGEIFVRSPHLAIGYLGDETMTHERFIPNPLTNLPGDRIYRSGDLGRYLPDGAVEFAGRKDNQVKIRGFRIELEEIETVLVQLPNIQEAVVIARSVNSNTQLVAYYVPGDKDKTLQASETRSYLKNKLPEYMIPAAFVSLEAIPLTPNRKIDRKALQNREIELESCHDYVAPQTETEKQLARIWEEVLGVEKVGIYDNFFELGGHSLLAIQMVTRIRERLGVEFPLKNIFDHATVNQLAALFPVLPLTLAENHNLTDVNIPKKNLKPNTSFPLSNGQLMPWLVWIGTKSTWNLYRIYDVKGPIDGFLLEQAFNALLQRNKSIWTRFTPWRPLQKITPPKHIHLSVIDLRGREPRTREENLEEAMRDAIYTRFDLTSPPLLRLSLIQHEDHQYKLVLVAPHIVIDNTVFHSLIDEFMKLYQAFASGQSLPPKPMDVPLSDYVYWEHKAARQALQKELDYWQQKLGSASLLYVPDSYLLPPGEPAYPYYVKVDSILLDTLAEISLQHKVSLQMSLSAVIAIVLHRITSQSDICLSLIVDKRLHHDIKNLVSSMIDMVPIRIQLSKKTSFTDLIAQIKYTTIEAYNHVRGFSAIPLSFLYQPPGQKKKGFVLRVKEHALRFFTWLLTRLWFPKQTYPGIFYAILVGRASRIHPKNKSRRKMHNTTSSVSSTPDGINVCLNIFPNFYQTSGTSKYICGDVVFSPGKPMKLPKTRQANVLYFTFTNNFEGHPLFMVTGMRLTPSAHQQITTTFGEVLAEVVKNPCSRLEKTTKSKS